MTRRLDPEKARERHKARSSPPSRPDWWLIPSKFRGRCSTCGNAVLAGEVVAYCHGIRKTLCQACGERAGIWKDAAESQRLKVRANPKPKPKRKRRRAKSTKRLPNSVTVRYECPRCGGPHLRSQCEEEAPQR
jgi:transcription elongation factor Elf1